MLIKHQLHSNFFIIFGFHPLFDKEPLFLPISYILFYHLQLGRKFSFLLPTRKSKSLFFTPH